MHQPGQASEEVTPSSPSIEKETWDQFESKIRTGRRRFKVVDIASKMTYEYLLIKKLCKRRPGLRQWTVRDDFCNMDPGVVVMSPSMQAAFMKVFRMKNKGAIRKALRDIVPVIEYRNREEPQSLLKKRGPDALIPTDQPETLNQKKNELFSMTTIGDNKKKVVLRDEASQAKLRKRIRSKLIKFQRQFAAANAMASRSVMYSEDDAIGYFLFRGPAMYAGIHRVLFEVGKLLPHFVPKTMLDFGAGTGTAMLAAKEIYDPGSMAYPQYRSLRQCMQGNDSSQGQQLEELRYDLKRLQRNNEEKKRARFLAVSKLIEKGDVDINDIPEDLRRELVEVARRAAQAMKEREARMTQARNRRIVDGTEWTENDPLGEASAAMEENEDADVFDDDEATGDEDGVAREKKPVPWWERFVDDESAKTKSTVSKRLKPLQEMVAIEPSPGMMSIGTLVTHDDIPNIVWKRYLLPEDQTTQHDLVVAAYSLSEIADKATRKAAIQQLWRMTQGVLVLVEFANISNFNMLMEARDTILEEKGVGLWDWQPTIVAPCPHEGRCPIRHSSVGFKKKRMRVCNTEALYKATFIEVWARHMPIKIAVEPVSYLVFARNEMVPERAERRQRELEANAAKAQRERDATQRELYEKSLTLGNIAFERLSDEALHRPSTMAPPGVSLTPTTGDGDGANGQISAGMQPAVQVVKTSTRRENWLSYPTGLPPAVHKFNRAFVDAGYQRTRAISPAEMLVVRSEMKGLRDHFAKQSSSYLRIVRDPTCRGKVQADFCTPQGDLIKARVYRRFYGDGGPKKHSTMRWQHIGGWKLLKRSRKGCLFPSDVPLYAVSKYPQAETPNTLVEVGHSTIELAAMQHDTPLDPSHTQPAGEKAELSHEAEKARQKLELFREQQESVDRKLEEIFGTKLAASPRDVLAEVDSRREVATEEWVSAVERAKRRVGRITEKTIPFSARIRMIRNDAVMKHKKTRSLRARQRGYRVRK
jgi:ribosomal protein RSM22 (predicted rRNA methylase)